MIIAIMMITIREFAKKRWSEDREFGARATFRDTVTISIRILMTIMTMMVKDKHYYDDDDDDSDDHSS